MEDPQDINTVEEVANNSINKKLNTFYALSEEINRLSVNMTSRQLGRVMRAVAKAPIAEYPTFPNAVEERVFGLMVTITDLKYQIISESLKANDLAKQYVENKEVKEGETTNG